MHVISPLPLPFPTNYTQLAAPTLYTIKTHTHTHAHSHIHTRRQPRIMHKDRVKKKQKRKIIQMLRVETFYIDSIYALRYPFNVTNAWRSELYNIRFTIYVRFTIHAWRNRALQYVLRYIRLRYTRWKQREINNSFNLRTKTYLIFNT